MGYDGHERRDGGIRQRGAPPLQVAREGVGLVVAGVEEREGRQRPDPHGGERGRLARRGERPGEQLRRRAVDQGAQGPDRQRHEQQQDRSLGQRRGAQHVDQADARRRERPPAAVEREGRCEPHADLQGGDVPYRESVGCRAEVQVAVLAEPEGVEPAARGGDQCEPRGEGPDARDVAEGVNESVHGRGF